ncbi:MAG TPA: TonB-dependent receptor, partial [Fontimonas sp.]
MKRLLMLCLLALPAWAQEAEPLPETTDVIAVEPLREDAAPQAISEAPMATQLEEIVVTATKRATSVREIPATVTALSGEDLEREGVQSIDQIVTLVPGVNLTDDGLGQAKRVTIRGVAADVNVNFTAGTLFGDIPFSDTFIPKVQLDPNPFDMATVEILKGPQGTLFGGSGLNGMIRYVPETPQFGETAVKYFAQFSDYVDDGGAGWTYGGVLNAPIGDDIAAVRLMAFNRDGPGFIDDTQSGKRDVNQTDQYGWRAMLGWHPDSDWRVSLMLVGQHTLQNDVAFTNNGDGRLERSTTPRPSPVETDYKLANLGIERAFEWADLISQTSVFEKEYQAFLESSRIVPGGQIPILGIAGYNHSNAFVQELRLVSADDGDSPWKWLGGLFYYRSDLFDCSDGALELPGLPIFPLPGLLARPCDENLGTAGGKLIPIHLEADLTLIEKAVFGEITRRLGERTEVTLGARYYQTESEGVITTAGALYAAQTGLTETRRPGEVKENGISPKASVSVRLNDDVLSYLTVSRGFRFGGIQLNSSTLTTAVPETFDSDSLWNYEIGVRSEWFDRTLFLDTSIYFIDWTDPQVFQQTRDGLATFIDNVGGVNG